MKPPTAYEVSGEVVVTVNGSQTSIGSFEVEVPVTVSLSGAVASASVLQFFGIEVLR